MKPAQAIDENKPPKSPKIPLNSSSFLTKIRSRHSPRSRRCWGRSWWRIKRQIERKSGENRPRESPACVFLPRLSQHDFWRENHMVAMGFIREWIFFAVFCYFRVVWGCFGGVWVLWEGVGCCFLWCWEGIWFVVEFVELKLKLFWWGFVWFILCFVVFMLNLGCFHILER